MHESHPGCGQHAGGKGYNSGGNYCLGWAGNCGDGGVRKFTKYIPTWCYKKKIFLVNSSWYLLCEACREKFIKMNRGGKQQKGNHANRRKNLKHLTSPSTISGLEPHVVMKNNAMFLLDLASSADAVINRQRRPSSSVMPSVSENNSPPDCAGPFSPVPPFQCLQALGAHSMPDEPDFYEKVLREQNIHEASASQRVRSIYSSNVFNTIFVSCSRYRKFLFRIMIQRVAKVCGFTDLYLWEQMGFHGQKPD